MTGKRQILFDATRLALRRRGAPPTGIDRVNLAYARWLSEQTHWSVTPVATWEGRLIPMNANGLGELIAHQEPARPLAAWKTLVAALSDEGAAQGVRLSGASAAAKRSLRDMGEVLRPFRGGRLKTRPGDIYLNVAHSGLEQPRLFESLRRRGLAPVAMIHDLIPITHAEYCGPGAPERHRARLDGLLRHGALIIANSTTTADSLAAYAKTQGVSAPPVHVEYLGAEPAFRQASPLPSITRPYFVCVGTIEARKNLAFLLTLWRRLGERLGEAAPFLVLVGRRGWENESVIDHLDRSCVARRLVHEVADLNDRQLADLLAGARALLAPSLAEGFDLPVTEALSAGAPVIASDIPVHREIAAGVKLIDPLDGPGWLAAIEAACAKRPLAPALVSKSWDDHFKGVAEVLDRLDRHTRG